MTGAVEKLTLPKHEQAAAAGVKAALQAEQGPILRTSDGADMPIPSELAQLFQMLAEAAEQGEEITVTVGDPQLRPREAAAELGMSRTHLCNLMDDGVIAFERVGTHRRIARSEVERFRRARADQAAARYAAATKDLPDAPDAPMAKISGNAPRRPHRNS